MIPMFTDLHKDRDHLGLIAYTATGAVSRIEEPPTVVTISEGLRALFDEITTSKSVGHALAQATLELRDEDQYFGLITSPQWPEKKLALYQTRLTGRNDQADVINRSLDALTTWHIEHDEPLVGLEAPGPILGQNWSPTSPRLNELSDKFLVYFSSVYKPIDWLARPPEGTLEAQLLQATDLESFAAPAAGALGCQPFNYIEICQNLYGDRFWEETPWYGKLQAHYAVAGYLGAVEAGSPERKARTAAWHQARNIFNQKQKEYHNGNIIQTTEV